MEILVTPPAAITWPGARARCALGRGGVTAQKHEGDGATPSGRFRLRRVFYRADRLDAPQTILAVRPIDARDGWCDDAQDPGYNRLVRLPHAASHEKLFRDDGLYDVVVELGHNDDPVAPGRGSAIFVHVAGDGFAPTEGCVALSLSDLLALLAACDGDDWITVAESGV